jgi:hypothetical protein
VPSSASFNRRFFEKLRKQSGKDIWLEGGGELIRSFHEAGLIDEYIIAIVPVTIGNGIPLFVTSDKTVKLQLTAVNKLTDEIVELRLRKKNSKMVERIVWSMNILIYVWSLSRFMNLPQPNARSITLFTILFIVVVILIIFFSADFAKIPPHCQLDYGLTCTNQTITDGVISFNIQNNLNESIKNVSVNINVQEQCNFYTLTQHIDDLQPQQQKTVTFPCGSSPEFIYATLYVDYSLAGKQFRSLGSLAQFDTASAAG